MLIRVRQLWSGGRLAPDVVLERNTGRLRVVEHAGATPDATVDFAMPAPSDLQVNGGGGVLFNDDPTPDGIAEILAAHKARGTGGILPTVITDASEVTEAAARAVSDAWGMPGLLGLHLEGPHINPVRRGTHCETHIRPLDDRTVTLVADLRGKGIPVMVTLAPEMVPEGAVARLARLGAVVSIGHSEATAEQTRAALAEGARCFTHLFNAMPPLATRDPGLTGVALTSDAAAGLIADGHHVAWDMVRIALAARPGPTFLVSDAMPTVGGPESLMLYGREIWLSEGRLINAEGRLAGAHLDMATAVANLVRHAGVARARAAAMASDLPRAVLGLPSQLVGGDCHDILAFDAEMSVLPIG